MSSPTSVLHPTTRTDGGTPLGRDQRNYLLASLGTDGDVLPYIQVGRDLVRGGDTVTFLANEKFQPRVEAAGMRFVSIGTREEYEQFVANPDFVDFRRAPMFLIRDLVVPHMQRVAETFERLHNQTPFDAVLRHLLVFGLESKLEKMGVPSTVGVPYPAFWFSKHDPALQPGIFRTSKPQSVINMTRRLGRLVARYKIDPLINEKREALGLEPRRDNLRNEFFGTGARQALGMWSPHFRPKMPDDPTHSKISGFSLFEDPVVDTQGMVRYRDFKDKIWNGEKPFLFCLGSTVHRHIPHFYQLAAEACEQLSIPAILLHGSNCEAPRNLPSNVLAVPYLPLSSIITEVSGIAHHGGVGTLARALHAGIPQITVPTAHDQFDNAERNRKLEIGITIMHQDLTRDSLCVGLRKLLDRNNGYCDSASQLAQLVASENGSQAAAYLLTRNSD